MRLLRLLLASVTVLLLLSVSNTAIAQTTVTVGTGTADNYFYGPIYRSSATSSYDFCQYHYVFTAAELGAAGVIPGATITSIAFEKANAFIIDEPGDAFFNVYLKNSTTTTLPTSDSWANLTGTSTLVGTYTYNTTNNLPNAAGWMTLTLATPIVYSGGSLELSTDWDMSGITSSSPTDGAFRWKYDIYPTGTSLGAASGSAITTNLNDASYGGTERPNTQFTFTAPACGGVTGLTGTNILSSTADISWTAAANAVNYNWKVVAAGAGSAGAAVASGTTSGTTVSVTGLMPVTGYDVYVETDCGGAGVSVFAGPYSFLTGCVNTLSGAYTIGGASADYVDIAAALLDLNTCGVSGPTTFNIAAGTYTGAITLGQITGASATNTITFDGGSAATTTITHDATGQRGVILLNGADYVTVQNLTIENTGTLNAYGVHLTGQADYNTVNNCVVNMTGTSSSVIAVLASGSLTSTGIGGNNANYTTISNSTLNNGYYGVRFYGNTSAAADNTNNTVENCTVNTSYYGIYYYYQDSPIATGNTVNLSNTGSGYGIYCGYARHINFSGNTLMGRTYALYVFQSNRLAQNPTGRVTIANNMITALGVGDGIYVTTTENFDIYHNTVTAENDQALWLSTSALGYDIRNNIFSVSGTADVIDLDANPTNTDVIDYNLYYQSGSGGIAIMPMGTYTDLVAWKNADGTQNVNSLEGDPSFLSATNLHLVGTLANDAGTPIAGITMDIDGDMRSMTTPDIGADEYTPPSCSPPGSLTTTSITATTADLGWTIGSSETMWDVEYGAVGFTQGAGTMAAVSTNPYTVTMLTPNTAYEFYVRADCGSATSPWIGPFAFNTLTLPVTVPYLQDFEGLTPLADFAVGFNAQADAFLNTTGANCSGSNNFQMTGKGATGFSGGSTSATSTNAWVDNVSHHSSLSLAVDATTITTPMFLTFDLKQEYSYGKNYSWFRVLVNGTQISADYLPTTQNADPCAAHSIDLSAYIGTVFNVTFQSSLKYDDASGSGGQGDNVFLDNVSIQAVTCVPPTNIATTNVTTNSADLIWNAGGTETQWEIEYDTSGFVLGTGMSSFTIDTTAALTGLTADTDYDFYVRAVCTPGDSSAWSSVYSFFTGYCTPNPSSVDGTGITNVAMGTINNATGTEPGNYGDYSAMVTDVVQGSTVNCDITYSTSIYTYGTKIWVDWNNDLDFDASELVYTGLSGNTSPNTLNATFAVPVTAVGNYRVRIGGTDTDAGPSSPCYTGSYGSFEDYTINVTIPLAEDVTVSAIMAGNCSSTEMVTVDITNLGTTTQTSIPVSYSVNGAAPVMEIWTGSLAFGATTQYTFAATFDASASGTYNLNASTELAADGNMGNDMSSTTITTAPAYTSTYAVTFEGSTALPTDWSSDGSIGSAHSPTNVLYENMYSFTPTFTTTTPKVAVAAGDFASFAYRYVDYYSPHPGITLGVGDTLNVQISTDCGETFTTVDQIHAGNHVTTSAFTTLSYDLSAYAGQTIVARMHATWGTGDYFLDIDNFFVGVPMTQTATSTDALCVGGANGTGTIAATDGLAPYTYAWSNGANTMTTMTLSPGVNYYTVTDAVGAMIMDSVTIGEPAVAMSAMTSVDAMVSCNGAMDAAVSATGMNGTAPYSYSWTNGGTSDSLMNVGAGVYAVLVTDANGCNTLESVMVSEPDAMTAMEMSTDITCNGAADGTAMITVVGGVGTPTYAWSNAATTASITGLAAGTYDVTATDANGCMTTGSVMIAEPMAITVTATADVNVNCNGAANGSATVTASGGTGMLTYAWSNGMTMPTATNLSGGTYDVTVTDANGCPMIASATVTEAAALVLAMSSVSDSLHLGNGSATATVSGGTAPYTYAWSNGGTTATLTDLVEGLLTVVITDANGCTIDGFVDVADIVSTTKIDYVSNLSIAPNPTRNNAVIDLELSQNADVAISIYTVTGVLVEDFGKENTSRATHTINVEGYAAGMYFVRFVVDNQVITKKLLVTK